MKFRPIAQFIPLSETAGAKNQRSRWWHKYCAIFWFCSFCFRSMMNTFTLNSHTYYQLCVLLFGDFFLSSEKYHHSTFVFFYSPFLHVIKMFVCKSYTLILRGHSSQWKWVNLADVALKWTSFFFRRKKSNNFFLAERTKSHSSVSLCSMEQQNNKNVLHSYACNWQCGMHVCVCVHEL